MRMNLWPLVLSLKLFRLSKMQLLLRMVTDKSPNEQKEIYLTRSWLWRIQAQLSSILSFYAIKETWLT